MSTTSTAVLVGCLVLALATLWIGIYILAGGAY